MCPGFVRVKGFVYPEKQLPYGFGVVSEYYENGSLYDILHHSGNNVSLQAKWTPTCKTRAIYRLAVTLAYLHQHSVIHGFVNERNVVFDDDMDVKLTDCWLSSMIESDQLLHYTGRHMFLPSDHFRHRVHSNKVDVFMWAVLVHEIITGMNPFGENLGVIECGEKPMISKSTPPAYVELLVKCLDGNPSARPPFSQIVDTLMADDGFILPGTNFDEFDSHRRKICVEMNLAGLVTKAIISGKDELAKLKTIADNGIVEAQIKYADMLERGFVVPRNMPEAVKYYEMAAEQNNAIAQIYLAKVYMKGDGVKPDVHRANELLKQAADNGSKRGQLYYAAVLMSLEQYDEARRYLEMAVTDRDADIMYRYATVLLDGPLRKDTETGMTYLAEAAEAGHVEAQYRYGKMLMEGDTIEKDVYNGFRFLKLAAEKGDANAEFYVAKLYLSDEQFKDNEKDAMTYLRLAALQHHVEALVAYGKEYMKGKYIEKSVESAKYYFREAADLGSTTAMCEYADAIMSDIYGDRSLAWKYYKMAEDAGDIRGTVGCAVVMTDPRYSEYNETEGLNILRAAVKRGVASAQYELGMKMLTMRNVKEGLKFLKLAADQEHVHACVICGDYMKEGRWSPKNVPEAVRLLKIAAVNDHPVGCYLYGRMLYEGDGVPVNREEGIKYVRLAAKMMCPEALTYIRELYGQGELYT